MLSAVRSLRGPHRPCCRESGNALVHPAMSSRRASEPDCAADEGDVEVRNPSRGAGRSVNRESVWTFRIREAGERPQVNAETVKYPVDEPGSGHEGSGEAYPSRGAGLRIDPVQSGRDNLVPTLVRFVN